MWDSKEDFDLKRERVEGFCMLTGKINERLNVHKDYKQHVSETVRGMRSKAWLVVQVTLGDTKAAPPSEQEGYQTKWLQLSVCFTNNGETGGILI